MSPVTKAEIDTAARALADKIGKAGRVLEKRTGSPVTTATVLKTALGVNTVHTVPTVTMRAMLTLAEVAGECRLSVYRLKVEVRRYVRSGGREGLGPFYRFGRDRRFDRETVERWKQAHLVAPRKAS